MEKMNPFMKALTVLICALILSFQYTIQLNLVVIVFTLILLCAFSRCSKRSLLLCLMPALLTAVSLFFTALWFTDDSVNMMSDSRSANQYDLIGMTISGSAMDQGILLSTRVLAFAMLGLLFALTTNREEFVLSLIWQGHLPPKYAYGVLAALSLLPTLKAEIKDTRLAYKVRGIRLYPWSMKPVFIMLVNTIHWSECIAMAMETKGFDSTGKRTYYTKPKVGIIDYCFLIGLPLGLLLLIR